MSILFYDRDSERMRRNHDFFTHEMNKAFVSVSTAEQLERLVVPTDITVIYFSDEIAAELMQANVTYIKGNVFLLCSGESTSSFLLAFYMKAHCLYEQYETEELARRIYNKNQKTEKELKKCIDDIMHACMMPVHLSGSGYARTAVEMCCGNEKLLCSVTKYLYPALSKMYSVTPEAVERALRHVIEKSWERGTDGYVELLRLYKNKRPSNKEFIAAVVSYVKRRMAYYDQD